MNTRQFIEKTKSNHSSLSEVLKISQILLKTKESGKVVDYLNQRINLSIQEKIPFGYWPTSSELNLLFDSLDKSRLLELDLIYELKIKDNYNTILYKSYFEYHNLIFPVHDDYGHIVGLIGRSILPDEQLKELKQPKYKYSKFHKQEVLYGLNTAKEHIRKTGKVMLVEGQFDCMAAQNNGHQYTVALGGTSLNYYQLFLLKKHGAKKIYLALDNDDPGQTAQEKILQKYNSDASWSIVKLPKGIKDLDQYFKQGQTLQL